MKIKVLLGVIGMIMFCGGQAQELSDHLWKDRVILIKGEEATIDIANHQLDELVKNVAEVKDRKLVFYKITDSKFEYTNPRFSDKKEEGKVSQYVNQKVINPENKYELILIGLDGGIKLRKTEFVSASEIFELIDKMPMRRNNLRGEQ